LLVAQQQRKISKLLKNLVIEKKNPSRILGW
jgi:hypothetical protein